MLFGCTRAIDGFDTSPRRVRRRAQRPARGGGPLRRRRARIALPTAGTRSARTSSTCGSPPGEEETFAFVLAYVEQGDAPKFERPGIVDKARTCAARHAISASGAVDAAFAALGRTLGRPASRVPGRLPRPARGADAEHLEPVPVHGRPSTSLARRASTRRGSAAAWDSATRTRTFLGFVHLIPDRARQRILDLAATQLSDGTCFHQYQPLTKQGNADDRRRLLRRPPLARPLDLRLHKETGDTSILDEPVGYADTPGSGENLLHHLETSIAYTLSHRGPARASR